MGRVRIRGRTKHDSQLYYPKVLSKKRTKYNKVMRRTQIHKYSIDLYDYRDVYEDSCLPKAWSVDQKCWMIYPPETERYPCVEYFQDDQGRLAYKYNEHCNDKCALAKTHQLRLPLTNH